MWRSAFLYLSTNAPVQHLATKSRVARKISSRFIAGDTLPEAVAATKALNSKGLTVELDFLGESVTDREQAEAAPRQMACRVGRLQRRGGVNCGGAKGRTPHVQLSQRLPILLG